MTVYTLRPGQSAIRHADPSAHLVADFRATVQAIADLAGTITDLLAIEERQWAWLRDHRDDPRYEQRLAIWHARWDELEAKRQAFGRQTETALGMLDRLTPQQAATCQKEIIGLDRRIRWSWTIQRHSRYDNPEGEPCPF